MGLAEIIGRRTMCVQFGICSEDCFSSQVMFCTGPFCAQCLLWVLCGPFQASFSSFKSVPAICCLSAVAYYSSMTLNVGRALQAFPCIWSDLSHASVFGSNVECPRDLVVEPPSMSCQCTVIYL